MLGGELDARRVEAMLRARGLEAPADHPGDRAGAGHALAEGRVVVLAAAHVADELEDVAVAVGKIRQQPFAEEVAHFERQAPNRTRITDAEAKDSERERRLDQLAQ